MKSKQDFYDNVLIKLKRQYSKDELVAVLVKKLGDAEIEIGKLKAEIDYLQNELSNDKDQKEINRLAKIEARKDELYRMKVEENKKQCEEIKQLRRHRDDLIAKCFSLEKHNN